MSTRLRTTGELVSSSPVPHYYEYCRGSTTCSVNPEQVGVCSMPFVGTVSSVWDEVPHRYPERGTYSVLPFTVKKTTCTFGGNGMKRRDKTTYPSCSSGSCTYKNWVVGDDWGYFLSTFSGTQNLTAPAPALDWSTLRNEAMIMAQANAKTPEVMGLVFLGEIQSTLRLVMRPWEGVVRLLRSLSSPGKRATVEATAALHLQFMFGVIPLMKDCESAIKVLQEERREMQRFYGTISDEVEAVTSNTSSNGIDRLTIKTTVRESVTARAGVAYQFDMTTSDRFGMNLSALPQSAWELIPLSFVFDWAINVGSFIAALTPVPGARYLGGYTVVDSTTEVRREVTSHTSDSASWQITRPCADWDEVVFKTKQRFPEDGGVSLPTYNLRLNTGKVASLTSLLIQLRKGFYGRNYRL